MERSYADAANNHGFKRHAPSVPRRIAGQDAAAPVEERDISAVSAQELTLGAGLACLTYANDTIFIIERNRRRRRRFFHQL